MGAFLVWAIETEGWNEVLVAAFDQIIAHQPRQRPYSDSMQNRIDFVRDLA